ncbi:hypothetical protein CK203_101141 [Vitis vinifera]|uniref:Retrotransposon gag domain-containing protein n=1 Tax=Vitis vinifera TaxID=29760 RepID=A0A438EEE4_VITVI|nr:hypothetical protein CK203_101141 [Vitis vinifera]
MVLPKVIVRRAIGFVDTVIRVSSEMFVALTCHHSFRPNLSGHISIRSSLSLSLSFRSSVPVLRAKGENAFRQSNRRQKTLTAGNFSGELSGDGFFLHRKERLEEISNLSQSTGTRNPSTRRHARFSGRRLHLTRRRVRAREPLSGDALPPPGSPDADQPPFYLFVQSEPCTCLFWGSFASAGPLIRFSGVLGYFFSTPVPARALKCSSTFPVHDKIRNGIITRHKLNGHNYLQWSQSVLLFICGKGKDEYLTGEAVMPETTEPGFRKWKIENSMIMSWLINSMNNDIGENFLLFGTAKDIWDAAKETYSSSENTSELFQVESALHDFRQGEQSVTQYYNTLTRELDDVRGRIMGIKPLPSLREAFSEVRREESRKKVMMGSKEQPAPTLDASTLAARPLKETCWKLHGKPADWKPKPRFDRDGRAHVAANSESTSVPEPSPFNKEQMEMLQKLLSQVGSGSTTGVAFTANRGGMSRG